MSTLQTPSASPEMSETDEVDSGAVEPADPGPSPAGGESWKRQELALFENLADLKLGLDLSDQRLIISSQFLLEPK